MTTRAGFCGCVLLALMLLPGVCAAQELPQRDSVELEDRWERLVSLWGHLGVGPFGVLAVSVDIAPSRYFAVEAGGGVTFDGPMLGLAPRLRLPITNGFGISAGPSLSVGDYDDEAERLFEEEREPYRSWRPAYIGGVTGAIEGRTAPGFSWRVFLGGAKVLNESDSECIHPDSDPCRGGGVTQFYYLGTAFGYAFE